MKLRFVRNLPLQYGANEAADRDDPNDPRYVRITDVTQDGLLRPETFKSLPLHLARPYLLADGDLLLARSGATVGKVFMYQSHWGRCCFAGYLIRLSVDRRRALPRFVWWYTQSKLWVQEVQLSNIQATIQNVSAERYGEFGMPRPSLPTQQAIAVFLDRKTAAIDALIEKKQKLLALLAEKRAALINQAVTKGLDPNVPMRDSGVAWIGEIPAHWEVRRLKEMVTMSGGSTPSKINDAYWTNGTIPWVSPKDMKRFRIADSIDHITDQALEDGRLSLLPPGVVLVVVRGMILARTFPVAVTEKPVTLNQDMKALTPHRTVRAVFLGRYLAANSHAVSSIVEESGHGTKVLRVDLLGAFPVLVPPLLEQEEIEREIGVQSSRLLDALRNLRGSIEHLQEYRQALITAAVTGQLDIGEETSVLAVDRLEH